WRLHGKNILPLIVQGFHGLNFEVGLQCFSQCSFFRGGFWGRWPGKFGVCGLGLARFIRRARRETESGGDDERRGAKQYSRGGHELQSKLCRSVCAAVRTLIRWALSKF